MHRRGRGRKCQDLRGTKHSGDITWCPTLAAEAFKRNWIWDGHIYRDQVLADIQTSQAAKVEKDSAADIQANYHTSDEPLV